MAMTFTQINTNGACSADSYCTGLIGSMFGTRILATAASGGSSGGTESVRTLEPGTDQFGGFIEITPDAGVTWDAGTWTIRLNVTTSNMNHTWASVHICRVNSSCVNQESLGSASSLGISLGTTGIKSANVTGSAATPGAGDKILIVLGFSTSSMNEQISDYTMNQNIDSPFTAVTPSLLWDPLGPLRPHLVRKVRDFFLGGLPPKLARLRMIQNAAGLYAPANSPEFRRAA